MSLNKENVVKEFLLAVKRNKPDAGPDLLKVFKVFCGRLEADLCVLRAVDVDMVALEYYRETGVDITTLPEYTDVLRHRKKAMSRISSNIHNKKNIIKGDIFRAKYAMMQYKILRDKGIIEKLENSGIIPRLSDLYMKEVGRKNL